MRQGRPLNMIVHLNVPDSVILDRIEGMLGYLMQRHADFPFVARWVHLPSGRVYNTEYSAPQIEGKDDVTGEPLAKRPDDTAVRLPRLRVRAAHLTLRRKCSRNDYRHTTARRRPYLKCVICVIVMNRALTLLDPQFFAKAYPGSLHTLTGSTSDEVSSETNEDALAYPSLSCGHSCRDSSSHMVSPSGPQVFPKTTWRK